MRYAFSFVIQSEAAESDFVQVSKAIRRLTSSAPREACRVCGKHFDITQQHHIVPVSYMARAILAGGITEGVLNFEIAWLCPNHHAYLHRDMDRQISNRALMSDVFAELLNPKHKEAFDETLRVYVWAGHLKALTSAFQADPDGFRELVFGPIGKSEGWPEILATVQTKLDAMIEVEHPKIS